MHSDWLLNSTPGDFCFLSFTDTADKLDCLGIFPSCSNNIEVMILKALEVPPFAPLW